MVKNCIFCKISLGDISSERIYENDSFFSVFDSNQKIRGHALVISKKHFVTTLDIPNNLGEDFLDCIKETASILMKKFNSDGFNIVNNNFDSAGQEVKHVHYHILPRKKGDRISIFN